MKLTDLSDDELVARLSEICLAVHGLTARMIVHLIEVEERRLDLKAACTSMFDFCVRRLGMSEGAAYRRIAAARLVRRFPSLLARIERGELHLSTLVLLRPHLTEENVDALADAVKGKSQREIEELVARIAPKPDVPSTIEKLPTAEPVLPLPMASTAAKPERPARIQPLAEDRYKVQLTASRDLRDKLERAKDLMMHRNPSGDLAVVVERALDLLIDKLEKERLAKTTRPRPATKTSEEAGGVPRAVRRDVFARDGEQCTFVDGQGRRCPSRAFLELDHVASRALGGGHETENVRVRCRAHNRLHAEEVFGKAHVARQVDFRQRKSRRVIDATPDIDVAVRGLVKMGFAKNDVCRAIERVRANHANDVAPVPMPALLREAIAALT